MRLCLADNIFPVCQHFATIRLFVYNTAKCHKSVHRIQQPFLRGPDQHMLTNKNVKLVIGVVRFQLVIARMSTTPISRIVRTDFTI